jgi:hypothetical protein
MDPPGPPVTALRNLATTSSRGGPEQPPIVVVCASQFPTIPAYDDSPADSESQYLVFNPVSRKAQRFGKYIKQEQPALPVGHGSNHLLQRVS